MFPTSCALYDTSSVFPEVLPEVRLVLREGGGTVLRHNISGGNQPPIYFYA